MNDPSTPFAPAASPSADPPARHELRAGHRVVLTDVPDGYPEQFNIVPGMAGTVDIIDSLGTVHVRWDAGQRFGIVASARHLLSREEQR